MSDSLRQSTGDKVASSVKPDSQKSTLEQGTDSLKSTADSVAGKVQPEGDKSSTQKLSDTASKGSNDASKQGGSVLESAQNTLSDAAQSASDTLGLSGKK